MTSRSQKYRSRGRHPALPTDHNTWKFLALHPFTTIKSPVLNYQLVVKAEGRTAFHRLTIIFTLYCNSMISIIMISLSQVMLNTKIFADMIVNRANLTTIRISGLDQGKMCTFLLKCTRNECDKYVNISVFNHVLYFSHVENLSLKVVMTIYR